MKLSRAAIAAMSADEFEQHEAEIGRWLRAGAVDDTEPPPAQRPAGHRWTREEIRGMDVDDFAAHEDRIVAAVAAGEVD